MIMGVSEPVIQENLLAMDPKKFEYFVADLWEKDGWETTVTQQSNDRGVDVIAERDDPVSQKMVIQAKRYSSHNRVGTADVQQYYALKKQENADIVAIVTTGSFTDPARDRGEELDVELVDGEDLVEMVQNNQAADSVQTHATQSQGEVLSPAEFCDDVITRVRLTRGASYLAGIGLGTLLLYTGIFTEYAFSSTIMWVGWVLIPIAAYVYTKAVPEASLSNGELASIVIFPLAFGPYYLYQEL
ncbi:restriction endonuclease [Haloarcula sp. H-GB4]|uniref:restriction endonuclease n=1 Tax=Haloarcula sp. H-GB4 TaxID=3069755 RepID=UPI0027B31CE3|nr:restriction endonuclease [Haloarcula sp. H-GB4]MDQ2074768.1 restriction endonuclease [Haloarcula sp. H-GB4]